jgi:hypothetical protein
MVATAKELGHVAFVATDHDYWMSPDKYEQQLQEAAALSEKYSIPVVVGLEITLMGEEAVLIGTDACREWLRWRDSMGLSWPLGTSATESDITTVQVHRALEEITKRHPCGLCLVHPLLTGTHPSILSMMDCYEVMNGGRQWPEDRVTLMRELMSHAKPVRGCDAHSAVYLSLPCNEVEEGEWNETKIIEWMKGTRNVVSNSAD